MIQIAVLMTCHNRRQKTLKCLRHLFGQENLDVNFSLQIYLVDDGSTDGTGLAVSQEYPSVEVIQGDGSLYWNRGMFTAWQAASVKDYDYYLWLNDDTYLYHYALQELISTAMATRYEGIVCGSIESSENRGILAYGGGYLRKNKYIANYPDGNFKACDIINGNCVLIPRSAFRKVGNLDWQFIHAIGDNDYSLRAKSLGVLSYSTGKFVASCAQHENLPQWCLPNVKMQDRIRNLYSPLGYSHPYYQFIYEKRHFGLFIAIKHFFSINLRVLIPRLWK